MAQNLGALASNAAIAMSDLADATEYIQDTLNTTLVAGANVTLTYDDPGNTLTIASVGGGGGSFIDTVADTGHPGSGTDIDLNVTGTTLTAKLLSSTTPQVERLGIGVVAGSTARLTLPATASLAGGIDFGGSVSLHWQASGVLQLIGAGGATSTSFRLASPSAGQAAYIRFYDGTTEKWRVYKDTTATNPRLLIRDEAGTRTCATFYPEAVVGNALPALDLGLTGTWDASTGGAAGGKIRTRYQVQAAQLLNSVNGERGTAGSTEDDSVNVDDTIGTGATHWWNIYHSVVNDAKGAFGSVGIAMTASKPSGTTYPNNYNETAAMVTNITGRNRGGYYVAAELQIDVESDAMHADAGPARSRVVLLNAKEYNPYTDYASGAAKGFGTSLFNNTGARSMEILSQGTKRLGTGILLHSTANINDEAAGEGGFIRAIALQDTAQNDIFCLDGFGRIGLGVTRDQTNNLTGLPAKLVFATGTTAAGGIQFGTGANAVNLYQSANDTLRLDDALSIGSFISVNNAAASGFIQMSANATGNPGAGGTSTARLYVRNGKIVFAYNDAGTTRYLKADVTSTGTGTWAFDTTAP